MDTYEERLLRLLTFYLAQTFYKFNVVCLFVFDTGLPDVPTYINWLKDTLPPNSRIGIDPFLISAQEFQKLSAELHASGHTAVAIPINIVDAAWKNRPALKLNALEPLEFRFSGRCFDFPTFEFECQFNHKCYISNMVWLCTQHYTCISYMHMCVCIVYAFCVFGVGKRASEKVEQVREQIRKMGTESHIISSLDSIACE